MKLIVLLASRAMRSFPYLYFVSIGYLLFLNQFLPVVEPGFWSSVVVVVAGVLFLVQWFLRHRLMDRLLGIIAAFYAAWMFVIALREFMNDSAWTLDTEKVLFVFAFVNLNMLAAMLLLLRKKEQ